jgi:hypothetical protein
MAIKSKGDMMGESCSTHRGDGICVRNVSLNPLKERGHFQDLGIDRRVRSVITVLVGKPEGKRPM